MWNDYGATAKDQSSQECFIQRPLSNCYVHRPVAVGRLLLLQCDGGEMTMMRNDYDVWVSFKWLWCEMTMMRDVSFKFDGEASSGERGAKWQWCEMSGKLRHIPAVRLTCIACFSTISQSILNRFPWNFVWTICELLGDYREIFIRKYCLAKKLDHLACNAIHG